MEMGKDSGQLSVGFLYDDTLDNNDGVAHQVKTIGAYLSSQGHSVCYLVGETKLKSWAGGKVYSLAKNQKVIFNGNRLSIPLPANRRRIKEVLAAAKLDVLHVQMPYSPFFGMRVIKSVPPHVAVVGTFHIFPIGSLARAGSRLLRLMYGRTLGRFDRIISVSPAAAKFAASAFAIRSIVIPNTIDSLKLAVAKRPPDRPYPQIVFLGRLVKRKGCAQLLEAFNLLVKELPDARLIVAGDGPERIRLEGYVRRHGLNSRVDFLGYIDEKQKPALLASADVACFPSLGGESFGIVLIEAMAAGAGVVLGGNNPGYKTVLGDQPQLLVDPNDKTAFARKLNDLLTNKAMAEALHAWQREEVKKYDISVVGRQVQDVYAAAIAKARKGRHNTT